MRKAFATLIILSVIVYSCKKEALNESIKEGKLRSVTWKDTLTDYYLYDSKGRLEYEIMRKDTLHYTYEAGRVTVSDYVVYTLNAEGLAISNSFGDTYSYDANGHMISYNLNGDLQTYEYQNDNLVKISNNGQASILIEYYDDIENRNDNLHFGELVFNHGNFFGRQSKNLPKARKDPDTGHLYAEWEYEFDTLGRVSKQTLRQYTGPGFTYVKRYEYY